MIHTIPTKILVSKLLGGLLFVLPLENQMCCVFVQRLVRNDWAAIVTLRLLIYFTILIYMTCCVVDILPLSLKYVW